MCIEKWDAVADFNMPDDAKERPAIYFVLKGENEEKAKDEAYQMGAELIRELTSKELATEGKDGSYDIEL